MSKIRQKSSPPKNAPLNKYYPPKKTTQKKVLPLTIYISLNKPLPKKTMKIR